MCNSEPYLIESADLASKLKNENTLVLDLGSIEEYQNSHVPGAVHLDYRDLRTESEPAAGLVPPIDAVVSTLQSVGISENRYVVAYDHHNNAAACRLLWTLAARPGRVYTRDELVEHITDGEAMIIDRNVDVHVSSIRQKLGRDIKLIGTVRGVGYKCND